jgi:hypothetical protein
MRNQRGRGSAFARRGSSFYNVSYSSRFRRDCTSKCRLVNVLLPIKVGAFSALLLPALLEPQLNISLEPRSCQLLSACQAQNRLARNILSQRGQRRRVERRAIRVATVYSAMSGPPECPLSRDEPALPERPRWVLSSLSDNTREGLLSLLVQMGRIDLSEAVRSGLRQSCAKGSRRRGHPRCAARVGSGATRTKVLPKFSPRSISAKAVGMTSSPSRISSR